jgi:homopolymeric O-antigen transport system permease protein
LLRTIWASRTLLVSFVRRQYQLRYRQSLGGLVWAIIPPLAGLGLGTVLFKKIIGLETGGSYTLFALAALVPWSFFATSLATGANSIPAAGRMVQRLAFPRVVLPLSCIGLALVDLLVALILFFIATLFVGGGLPATVLWFPVLLAIELVLVTGIVLLVSALNVFARDVAAALPFAVQGLLFLTPVMYPLNAVPESLRPWFLANPMTGLVESFRDILIAPGHAPSLSNLAPTMIGAAVALLLGCWYFSGTEKRFADVV